MPGSLLIYGLTDPSSGAIRYIGKSSNGLRRPRAHGKASVLAKDNTHKGRWLRTLVARGERYGVVVLECVHAPSALDQAEIRWIAYGRASGWPLTNTQGGGQGASPGNPVSATTRERIRQAKIGKPRPDLAARNRTHPVAREQSQDERDRRAVAMRGNRRGAGRVVSADVRAKIAEGMRAAHARHRPATRVNLIARA